MEFAPTASVLQWGRREAEFKANRVERFPRPPPIFQLLTIACSSRDVELCATHNSNSIAFHRYLRAAIAMALAIGGVTIARLSQHAVGTNAGLGVHAPEQAIVARRYGRVGLSVYEQSFP